MRVVALRRNAGKPEAGGDIDLVLGPYEGAIEPAHKRALLVRAERRRGVLAARDGRDASLPEHGGVRRDEGRRSLYRTLVLTLTLTLTLPLPQPLPLPLPLTLTLT